MNSFTYKGFRAFCFLSLVLLTALLSGCLTPEEAIAEVDREAYDIVGDKQESLYGARRPFRIDPGQHRIMLTVVDPETGLVREGAKLSLDLATVLEIAAVNSRTFQDQKELLYQAALGLMSEREDFRNSPFAGLGGSASSSGTGESIGGDAQFGVTNMIERGGSFALSLGLDFLRFVSSPTSESYSSFLNLNITLPFLRNAGREIAYENLVQADRDALYALRNFERFKQTYGVSVVSQYLRVLAQSERIRIAEANYKNLQIARGEVEERFEVGRVSRVEVDQNKQAELSGEVGVVNAKLGFESSLDGLKDFLGLPVDLEVTIRKEDRQQLEALVAEAFDVDGKHALKVAFESRLDFRNVVDGVADAGRRVHVAENGLLPDFTLNLAAAPVSKTLKPLKYNYKDGTYSAAFDMDLALDRDLESISLRQAVINLDVAIRNQEDAREGIKLDVRTALRSLRQARENHRIANVAVELARKRVSDTRDLQREGRATTRDFLESQDALVRLENDLVDRTVDYRIAFLDLFRDTGALVVSAEGLNHDVSRKLLAGE